MANSLELQKCHHCNSEQSELFHCKSCGCKDEKNKSEKEYFCQICISSHLVIGHELTDKKGHKPLICDEHKMLEHEYCRTCDVTFCWRCTSKHSKHEFDTLEQRGSELRGKVFEMLTELETRKKPLRVRKETISEVIQVHRKEQQELREKIDEEIEKLRQHCYKIIDDNCTLKCDDENNVTEVVDKTVDLQERLRDLLASSNAHLVRQFVATQEDVEENTAETNTLIDKMETILISCKFDEITDEFEEFEQKLSNKLKSLKLVKLFSNSRSKDTAMISHAESVCDDFIVSIFETIFRISTGNGQLKVQKVSTENYSDVSLGDEKNIEFEETVCKHYLVFGKLSSQILILTETNNIYTFDPEKELVLEKHPYPPHNHILLPYNWSYISPTIYWCYWDEDNKLIRFTDNDTFTIKCDTLPRATNSHQWNYFTAYFITDENNVIVADVLFSQYWVIPFNSTAHISCVTADELEDEKRIVFIWCYEDESVFISEQKNGKEEFSIPVRYQWNTSSLFTEITFNKHRFSFIPRLPLPTGKNYDLFHCFEL